MTGSQKIVDEKLFLRLSEFPELCDFKASVCFKRPKLYYLSTKPQGTVLSSQPILTKWRQRVVLRTAQKRLFHTHTIITKGITVNRSINCSPPKMIL